MIIKSMSRKDATFSALVAYVDRINAADLRFALRHNIHAQATPAMISEFESNGRLLKARKNGVIMYHEIISITRATGITAQAQKEALRHIALAYLNARAPRCLGYGMLHDDHAGHLHYHLVLSANERGERNRHSLTRQQFRQIQLDIEAHVLKAMPQLEQKPSIGKKANRKQSQAGTEIVRRGGKKSQVDALKDRVLAAFKAARTEAELFVLLTDAGLELYTRGKTVGVRDLAKERNHRLETLGLSDAHTSMRQRFAQAATKVQAVLVSMPKQVAPSPLPAQSPAPVTSPPPQSPPIAPQAQAPVMTAQPAPPVAPTIEIKGKSKAARVVHRLLQGAEKVVGAVAREGGAIANQVLGGAVKHTTGMIETAVHTIGGPKPHANQSPAQAQQQPAPTNAQTNPATPKIDIDALTKEHLRELERLQADQLKHGNDGPKQQL